MKTKILILIILISSLNLLGCEIYSKEEKELLNHIESFLDTQYEAYVNLEYKDIECFLDMSMIQNKNKVNALKKLIIQRKHIDDMEYAFVNKSKYPFEIIVNDINVNGEYASVKIELKLEGNKNYPDFISDGLNNFVLKMNNNTWQIVCHDYEGLTRFEVSDKKLLPEIDEDRIRRIIDNEYVSPLG